MEHNYTENDLVRLMYNEIDAIDYIELLLLLEENPELKKMHTQLEVTKKELPDIQYTPSTKSLNLIMAYNSL